MAKEPLGSMSLYQVNISLSWKGNRTGDQAGIGPSYIVQARSSQEAKAVAIDVCREKGSYFKGLRLRLDINSLCPPEKNQPGWVYPVAGGAGGKSYFHTFR